jgi:transcriptional regulator with XRE-family HTH domain
MAEVTALDVVTDYADATRTLLRTRAAVNITQEVLAERLGVAQATVARHESGDRVRSGEDLFAAAHALGLDIAFVPRPGFCPNCGQARP